MVQCLQERVSGKVQIAASNTTTNDDADALRVNEKFTSIQGEGRTRGWGTYFIRLQGCNLRCEWCDTAYAQDVHGKCTLESLESLVKQAEESRMRFVTITGGEPLTQPKSIELAEMLAEEGFTVSIFTNGSMLIPRQASASGIVVATPWDKIHFVMDWKLSSSGMSAKHMKVENLGRLRPEDDVKFVIGSAQDWKEAMEVIRNNPTKAQVVFGPVWTVEGKLFSAKELWSWILRDCPKTGRFQIQEHKVVFGPVKRGV